MAEDPPKTWRYLEILKNSKLSSAEKKRHISELLDRLAGDDCPLEALSLIMGRNYKLCSQQMDTLQELVDTLGNDSGELHRLYGLKHAELVGMLIDCNIIVISLKLFAAQLNKWKELANCGKNTARSIQMTTCLIRVRFDCLLIVSFICNNTLCSPKTGNYQFYQLCKSQLLASNAYRLLITCVENDPSVVVSYYSLMLLDNLVERYFTIDTYEKTDHQLDLLKLGQYIIKDTLSTKLFTWLKEGHASDTEKQYMVCMSDDGSLKDCWKSSSERRYSAQAVRDCALRWSTFTFNHCLALITHVIGLHINKKILRAFVNDATVLKALVKWTRTIPVLREDLERVKNSVKLVVQLIDEYDVVVEILFNDSEFMQAIQLGVRHPDSTLATFFLMCVGGMAKKNAVARKKLTNDKRLLKAIVRSCCAVHFELQTVAIYTLFNLVDRMTAPKIVDMGFSLRIVKFLHKVYHASDNISTILVNLRCRLERYTTSVRDELPTKTFDDLTTPYAMMSQKEEGNELYKRKQFQKAAEMYSKVLEHCPPILPPRVKPREKIVISDPEWYTFPAALHSNRAQCYLYMRNYEKAIADCDDAIIRSDSECPESHTLLLKSTLRRSTAFYELGMWTESLLDIGFCLGEDPNNSNFKLHFNKVFKKYREVMGTEHLVKRCVVCMYGEGEKLKRCANCTERYCSRQCQRKAWDDGHKNECNKKEKA